ncbi:MAG: proline iminopeptidase-family hydrolase [Nocardioidaceae bacterium]
MPIPEPTTEGTVDFGAWQTWYRISGSLASESTPLVVLHGGPGAAHDYTLRIARLAEHGRQVVHYDQLGIGRSTHLPDRGADFWTVQLFLDELDNLLSRLHIADRYHLLGQSWGGMLAAEHAVRRPAGLRSLVIADSPASMELWRSETARLVELLPSDVQQALSRHEQAGTTDHPDYQSATDVFNAHFVCRVVPNPPEVVATYAAIEADPTVYHTMNGPNEFHVTGSLRDWSIVERANRVNVPTLLINGRYDEATTATMQPFSDHIEGARWEVFEESSHMPHVEEEERYLDIVGKFLDGNERAE